MCKTGAREYTPSHEDEGFNIQWWADRGVSLGDSTGPFSVYLNAIRDGSGRYYGFCIVDSKKPQDHVLLLTSVEAEAAIHSITMGYTMTEPLL